MFLVCEEKRERTRGKNVSSSSSSSSRIFFALDRNASSNAMMRGPTGRDTTISSLSDASRYESEFSTDPSYVRKLKGDLRFSAQAKRQDRDSRTTDTDRMMTLSRFR